MHARGVREPGHAPADEILRRSQRPGWIPCIAPKMAASLPGTAIITRRRGRPENSK